MNLPVIIALQNGIILEVLGSSDDEVRTDFTEMCKRHIQYTMNTDEETAAYARGVADDGENTVEIAWVTFKQPS